MRTAVIMMQHGFELYACGEAHLSNASPASHDLPLPVANTERVRKLLRNKAACDGGDDRVPFLTPPAVISPAAHAGAPPSLERPGCVLEAGAERVRFAASPESSGRPFVRVRMYDEQQRWLADEMLYGAVDAPIYPVGELLDPQTVSGVTCTFDGFSPMTNPNLFVRTSTPDSPGRTTCEPEDGLIVDGGPDAQFAAAVSGKNWIAFEILPFINHFLGSEPTDFRGNIFSAKLDGGSEQRMLISGSDGTPVWFLFTNVPPGLHRIDFGPWGDGSHPFCLRTGIEERAAGSPR